MSWRIVMKTMILSKITIKAKEYEGMINNDKKEIECDNETKLKIYVQINLKKKITEIQSRHTQTVLTFLLWN